MQLTFAADRPCGKYSGGMKRRLELARALMHQPEILLLDEPTSGLDENGYRQVWDHLEGLRRKEGLTIIVVTHRGDEAERCDRAMVLDEGRVIAEGTPEALRAQLEGDLLELDRRRGAHGLLAGPGLRSHRARVLLRARDRNRDAALERL